MYKQRVKKVAPVHKYFSSNCLVKCHHPYIAICWAIRLPSPQSARQRDHQLCNAQALALLKRIFSQPLSHKHCSLPTLRSSRLLPLWYRNVFLWHYALNLILGWSSSCRYFAEQTLQVVSLFSAAKDWLTNSYYLVPSRRGRSLSVCWKSWAVWCQNCIRATSLQPAHSATLSPTSHFLPQNFHLILCSSSSSRGSCLSSLFSLAPAEFRDFCRRCQRRIPRKDTRAQVAFQDLSGGPSPKRRGQEPWRCYCLQG